MGVPIMGATSKPSELAAQVHKNPASSDLSGSPSARGPISLLQEYVQEASKPCALPSNFSVLQWDLDARASGAILEFRATVSFFLEGVPHHVVGVWKPSKKAAQRDAAERALGLYAPRVEGEAESRSPMAAVVELRDDQPWYVATAPGDVVLSVPIPSRLAAAPGRARERPPPPAGGALPWPRLLRAAGCGPAAEVPLPQRLLPRTAPGALLCAPPGLAAPPGLELLEDTQSEGTQQEHTELLKDFCDEMGWPQPRFNFRAEGDGCLAMVEVVVLGVLHTFSGQLCDDLEAAEDDVAKRVLWYLRAPGSEDAFEPDKDYAMKAAKLTPPKADWVKDGGLQDEVLERKMTVMVLQNRLQQIFANHTVPGMPVWNWSYERGRKVGLDPRLIRARVTIPLAGRQFVGKWTYGQRNAQIDACAQVTEFIDQEYPPQKR